MSSHNRSYGPTRKTLFNTGYRLAEVLPVVETHSTTPAFATNDGEGLGLVWMNDNEVDAWGCVEASSEEYGLSESRENVGEGNLKSVPCHEVLLPL